MSETKGHDLMCPATQPVAARHRPACQCDLIVDIRADERERYAAAIKAIPLPLETTILSGLRTKVERLPVVVVDLDPDPHGRPIERRAVLLSDVLALFAREDT